MKSIPILIFLVLFCIAVHAASAEETYAFTGRWDFSANGHSDAHLAVDSVGNVYVANYNGNCVLKFSSNGTFLTKWGRNGGDGSSGSGNGEFFSPSGIAIDSAGIVYVVDTGNRRVQKFTSNGSFIAKWGQWESGFEVRGFRFPMGIATDGAGYVYVVDAGNYDVLKFTSDGTFVTKWGRNGGDGSSGSGDGEFYYPDGIAVDGAGNVYVADTENNRIQKFSSDGIFIGKWGTAGSGNGQLSRPYGVAIDNLDRVYVTDNENHRIQKFTSAGTYITTIGGPGVLDGEFYGPRGIAVDSAGFVYVSEFVNTRIHKFMPTTFVTKWGTTGSADGQFDWISGIAVDGTSNVYAIEYRNYRAQKFTSDGTFVTKWGSHGAGDGQHLGPTGIAVSSTGDAYVADYDCFRVQKTTSNGAFIRYWGIPTYFSANTNPTDVAVDSAGNVYVVSSANHYLKKFTPDGTLIKNFGNFTDEWDYYNGIPMGSGDGEFMNPNGIAADNAGNIYVADTGNDRIQKFSSDGTFIGKWGTEGRGDGQFSAPGAVAVDGSGNVYVADTGNHRVQVFTPSGTSIMKWGRNGGDGSAGQWNGSFNTPGGIAVDRAGYVYVADTGNNRIQKFAPVGESQAPCVLIPGGAAIPRDLSDDGLYEDVNGNGRADFADVVLYFNQMTWIAANEPLSAFDYNGNGRIDFADVVWLFTHL